MSISDALGDIKAAVISGKSLNDDLISEVAADYDLHPNLLERKIQ